MNLIITASSCLLQERVRRGERGSETTVFLHQWLRIDPFELYDFYIVRRAFDISCTEICLWLEQIRVHSPPKFQSCSLVIAALEIMIPLLKLLVALCRWPDSPPSQQLWHCYWFISIGGAIHPPDSSPWGWDEDEGGKKEKVEMRVRVGSLRVVWYCWVTQCIRVDSLVTNNTNWLLLT